MVLIINYGCRKDKDDLIPTTVTDIDGNVYHTVTIGKQVWMVENLRVTRYRNGDSIGTTVPAISDISDESSPKYQWAYAGMDSLAAIYGRLYSKHAVFDSRRIAPAGWHVPTYDDWNTLTTYLGGLSGAGEKMKSSGDIEAGTGLWRAPNTSGNEKGFTALPGGSRNNNGYFVEAGQSGYWWSSTEDGANSAWFYCINYRYTDVLRGNNSADRGFSVRCVMD